MTSQLRNVAREYFGAWTHGFGCVCAARAVGLFEALVFGQLAGLVPTSDGILPERYGEPHCLERDLLEAKEMIKSHSDDADDVLALERWKDERRREIEQRYEHAADLCEFLEDLEEERVNELQRLKNERLASIEERLHEDGWDTDDMVFPDETFTEWKQLVLQPKPLTDRIWTNLYPKLVPLLRANRERNRRIEQVEKFHEREMVIHECMGVIQRAYPPLAKVSVSWGDRPDAEPVTTELDVPFPTTAEASRWGRIKTLAESDLDPDDVEDMFFERERNVGGCLGEWMRKIHDDVLIVWNGGRSESQHAKKSKKEGGVRRSTRKSKAALGATCGTDLPRRTMVFTEPNGAVCTSPDELSDDIRLLLRADTVFRASSGPCYYPDIIPSPVVKWVFTEFGEAPRFGDVWDRRNVEKDVETSDVARKILDRMGNPDVSHPELGAMGKAFLCMRCKWDAPVGWLDFLKHYSTELSRWNEGIYNLSSRDDADEIVFNNTHDLDPSNTEPILKILDPIESVEVTRDRTKSLIPDTSERDDEIDPMMCLMCDTLGVEATYRHRWTLDFEGSPMISHLRDVHGIQTGRYAIHYGRLWHATVTGDAGDQ
ncbi:hypothetical protein RhiLY_12801 [Ceratobasidium sp. AG-Ba]|nr:hypothetical protein RhiLY_12801 [Ceratobasidium sp. AG-Ba]